MEGTFDVAVDTPKLHRRGTLALKSKGNDLSVRLSVGELDGLEFAGTCEDKAITVEGTGEFGDLGMVDFAAEGEVWGNSIDVKCDTSIGRVSIFGTRLSMSAGDTKSSHEYMMAASRAEFSEDDGTMYSGLYADGG